MHQLCSISVRVLQTICKVSQVLANSCLSGHSKEPAFLGDSEVLVNSRFRSTLSAQVSDFGNHLQEIPK